MLCDIFTIASSKNMVNVFEDRKFLNDSVLYQSYAAVSKIGGYLPNEGIDEAGHVRNFTCRLLW